MPILIDGHNLLYAVRGITEGQIVSEIQLCSLISDYFRQTKQRGEIIFDGYRS